MLEKSHFSQTFHSFGVCTVSALSQAYYKRNPSIQGVSYAKEKQFSILIYWTNKEFQVVVAYYSELYSAQQYLLQFS
jgi:hypothetical protein